MGTSPFGALVVGGRKNSHVGRSIRREGVRRTAEFQRVAGLPVRSLEGSVDVEGLSAMLRLPDDDPRRCRGCDAAGCVDGHMTLFPDQAYALVEMHDLGGTFVGVDVGGGKALLTFLGATVQRLQRPMILLPANMRQPTLEVELPKMRRHWRIPDTLTIESYESLSSPKGKTLLEDRMPDGVFCDEAHNLKDETTSRGSRFMRYFDEVAPDTRLSVFSGSFWDRELGNIAHLLRLCLRHRCPIPFSDAELQQWASAIDAGVDADERFAPGALLDFVAFLEEKEVAQCRGESVELARACLGWRMRRAPGVIFSTPADSPREVRIRELVPAVPADVVDAFRHLREHAETPQGELITDDKSATGLYRAVRQLAQGFYYRWVWPGGVVNRVWLDARREWHKTVRLYLGRTWKGIPYDSHGEIEHAAERHERYTLAKLYGQTDVVKDLEHLPRIDAQSYRNWTQVKPQYVPVTEAVWISTFLVDRVASWLEESPGIAWVESSAMGQAIRRAGFRYYGGGEDEIVHETVSCAAAIKAHGTGKNLQHAFHRNLVIVPMTRGLKWQQLIGRTDRHGQKSPFVEVDLFLHARELLSGFEKARDDSAMAQRLSRVPQKLCRATYQLTTTEAHVIEKIAKGDPLWIPNTKKADQ